MSPAPAVGAIGQELYDAVAPLAFADGQSGWALLALCGALGTPYEGIAVIVRDDDGKPGWSIILDVDRAPAEGLAWLGQFVGVRIDPSLDDAAQRTQIREHNGFQRGRPAAIVAALQAHLTGTKSVTLTERDGGPYKLSVRTLVTETPDPDAAERAVRSQLPGGITLTFTVA